MKEVSVIVPVYKVEPYLRRCVDSILAQTFKNFELILVDDGSPDNCPAICDEYAEKDKRVQVIHQENGGLSAARNAGIDWTFANSDSQWISFVDSDDWVHSEYLERLLNAAKDNGYVSACEYIKTTGEEPQISKMNLDVSACDTRDFFVMNNVYAVVACGKLYPKECFRNIRYPIGKIHEDEFITYRILFQKPKIMFIPAPMYYYFQNPTSIMNSPWTPDRLSCLDAYKERVEFFLKREDCELYNWALSVYIWAVADLYKNLQKDPINFVYAKGVKKRLFSDLIHYHKNLPIQKFGGAYEVIVPKIMQIYWICCLRWKRLRRLFRSEDLSKKR